MSRYKGRTSAKSMEKDFPHVVEMVVPEGGLRGRLDAMLNWHSARGIPSRHGRGRREEGRDYIRWCFADVMTANAFKDQFGVQQVKP